MRFYHTVCLNFCRNISDAVKPLNHVESICSAPLSLLLQIKFILRCQNLFHINLTIFVHLEQLIVFIDCVAKVLKHLHLDVFELRNSFPHFTNHILLVLSTFVSLLFQLHCLKLFVEELGLFKATLLLADHLGRLEVQCLLLLSLLLTFLLKLGLSRSLLLSFFFKLNHLLVGFLKLQRLLLLTDFLRLFKP